MSSSYTALDLYTYDPVHVVPEIAASLFIVAAIILTIQIIKTNTAAWVFVLVATALSESLGYITRAVCIQHPSMGLFISTTLLLLLPPNALAFFNYKTVGEISRQSYDPDRKFWLKPGFVVWVFFASDVVTFVLQAGGGALTVFRDTRDIGNWICSAGLAAQIVFITIFLFITFSVYRSPLYTVTKGARDRNILSAKRRVTRVVLVTTLLLYVRTIYRLVESVDGYGGKIYAAEWAFYVFDFVPIFSMFLVYIVFFVGYNFPRHITQTPVVRL